MLRKKEVYTNITPIPSFIPRQLAIDILHSHGEVITLNPLVLEHKPIKAPRDCPSDEFYSTWYEITERIQYIPGMGKMGSGKISFRGCFHDMPWGLQTHIYAPMNIDMRNKYRIAGNQSGVEPPEQRELGLGAPADGLYLREDIEIKCNITMVSFVKSQMKAASKEMVTRMIKKAELLDAGVLHAMIEDGKLKTLNPADRTSTIPSHSSPALDSASLRPPQSPGLPYQIPRSPPPHHQHFTSDAHAHGNYPGIYASTQQQSVPMELPGDFYHTDTSHLQPPTPGQSSFRDSTISSTSAGSRLSPALDSGHWSSADYQSSAGSRPTSYSSDGMRSPPPDSKGFAQELPTHEETREEHRADGHAEALKHLEAKGTTNPYPQYAYNPQDYEQVRRDEKSPRHPGPHPSQRPSQNPPPHYYYTQ